MVRLKGSTLIETLAAMVIVAFVLGAAYTLMSSLYGNTRTAMTLRAEKEIENRFTERPTEDEGWTDGELSYEIKTETISSKLAVLTGEARIKERILVHRRIIIPIE